MLSIVAFLGLLGVLITAHELGHFVVAKLAGVKVETFSIGFGPAIVAKKFGETEYRLAWIPLGGYVKMLGQDEQDVPDPGDAGRGLLEKPALIRILVAAAGPAMNLALPFAILLPLIAFSSDYGQVIGNEVGSVDEGMAAYKAGLREGDQIVAIDGEPIHAFWQVFDFIENYQPGAPLKFEIQRDGQKLTLEVTPEAIAHTDALMGFTENSYRIGYRPDYLASHVALTDSSSALAAAGLKSFDRVLSVNGKPTPRYIDVTRALAALKAGETAALEVERETPLEPKLAGLMAKAPLTLRYTSPGQLAGLRHAGSCVTSVAPKGPAAGKIQVGDCLVSVDGDVHSLGAFLHERLSLDPEKAKQIKVLRDGKLVEVSLAQARYVWDDPLAGELNRWQLGFVLHEGADQMVFAAMVDNQARMAFAWNRSVSRIKSYLNHTTRALGGMFSGRVSPTQLSGPVTIFYLAGEHARAGLEAFLQLMVLLSLSIAVLNLLPIPMLDGGQMLIAAAEGIMRRPLPEKVRTGLQLVGMLLVGALILFAFVNDAFRMWRLSNG